MAYPNILQRMAGDFGSFPNNLNTVIKTAPLRYKIFYIQKRDGTLRQVHNLRARSRQYNVGLYRNCDNICPFTRR